LTPTQKKKAIDDAMNWLRNNDPNPADGDDPTAHGEPCYTMPGRLSPEERPGVVEDSVNWLRNNDVKPEDVNEPSYGSDEPRGNTNAEGQIDSTQKRRIDDAMNWLRNDPTCRRGRSDSPGAGEPAGYPCPAVCLGGEGPSVEDSVNCSATTSEAEDVNEPTLRL
jgi:hypothetical protein